MNVAGDAKVLAQSQSVGFNDSSSVEVPAGAREPTAISHGENPNHAESQQFSTANFQTKDPDFLMTQEKDKGNRRKRPTTAPRSRPMAGPLVRPATASSQK